MRWKVDLDFVYRGRKEASLVTVRRGRTIHMIWEEGREGRFVAIVDDHEFCRAPSKGQLYQLIKRRLP